MVYTKCYFFSIAESICNAGGLGFTGYDDEGKEVWANAKNIEILPMEFPTNPRQLGLSWHLQSSLWIRRYGSEICCFKSVIKMILL